MLCDDSGLCSNIFNNTFHINDKPIVENISIIPDPSGNGNLVCDYDKNPGQIFEAANDSITWYRFNVSVGYCGDGSVDILSEQCDVGNMGAFEECTDMGFTGGTLSCDLTSCRHNTDLCTGGTNNGAYCGDGVKNIDWEKLDIESLIIKFKLKISNC